MIALFSRRAHRRGACTLLAIVMSLSFTSLIGSTPAKAETATVYRVTDFGADPTGVRDSAPAVAKTIQAAKAAGGPSRIVFPTGTYQLYPDQAEQREWYVSNTVGTNPAYAKKRVAILIENMSDVVVDGQGSTLVLHGQQTTIAAVRSQRVTFTNFSTDWVTPRTVDLTTVAVRTNGSQPVRDYRIPDGYRVQVVNGSLQVTAENSPYTGQPYWSETLRAPSNPSASGTSEIYQQMLELDSGRNHRATWTTSTDPLYAGVQSIQLNGQIATFTYAAGSNPGTLGRVFTLRSQPRDTPGGFFFESTDVVIDGINFGYVHGFGLIAQMNNGLTVRNNSFRPPAGSWRQTAGFADLVQVSGDKGQVLIENNRFGYSQDDPINVHGTYMMLESKNGSTATFGYRQPDTAGFPQFYPGDDVTLVDRTTMLDLPWTAKVVSVVGPNGTDTSHDLNSMTVTFDKALPDNAVPGSVVAENLTYSPDVTVRGNHFEAVPTRGILMTTRGHALIENNIFDQMEMASIFVSADSVSWYESSVVRDLTIRNNVFIRPAIDSQQQQPVIWFNPLSGGGNPDQAAHSGVVIEDNTFLVGDATILDAKSVKNLTFRRNVISRYTADRAMALTGGTSVAVNGTTQLSTPTSPTYTRSAFVLRGSTAVSFSGNTYDAGINRRIDLVNTTADRVSNTDTGLLIGANSYAPQTTTFVTSNPGVAKVSSTGVVTGLSAGQTQITGYRTTPTGTVKSAPVTVTVTGTATTSPRLADSIYVVRPEPAHTQIGDNQVTLTPSGAGSLWMTGNKANNLLVLDTPQLNQGASAVVKMTGRPQQWYEEAGLMVYAGDDDYATIQRKFHNGSPALNMVTETKAQADESRTAANPSTDTVWLRLTRTAAGIQGSYSLDGTAFTNLGTPVADPGPNAKLALVFAGRENTASDAHTVRFEQLTVNGTPVALTTSQPATSAPAPAGGYRNTLFSATFDGISLPGSQADVAASAGVVTTVAPELSSYGVRLTPDQAGTTFVVTVNGVAITPTNGRYAIAVAKGATVLEVTATAPDGRHRLIHRWVTLRN